MISKWSSKEASDIVKYYGKKNIGEDLALRIYSTRLLGKNPNLVLHGGGNSSVKTKYQDPLGNTLDAIHVKGSGWDMGNIEPEGFPTLDLDFLRQSLKILNSCNLVVYVLSRILFIKIGLIISSWNKLKGISKIELFDI